MKTLGYYNGNIDELDCLKIPFCDRASFFGDGVYDSAYSKNRKVFALDEHIDRFYRSAKLLNINIPLQKDDWKDVISECLKKTEDDELFVYFQATRGSGKRNHLYDGDEKANMWISLYPKRIYDFRQPIKAIVLPDKRFLYCNAKTLNLIPSVLANKKADEKGAFEAILHRRGRVTECAHSNVHILKDGKLITAPCDNKILAGITRKHILDFCKKTGIPVEERPYNLKELFSADEVFISSAGAMGLRIESVDGMPANMRDGDTLLKIQQALQREFDEATC